jgi:hypothetical protein
MKAGDKIEVVGIPPGLLDKNDLNTRSLFEKCVGKTFEVVAIENVEGLDVHLLQLDVGRVSDVEPWEHTISEYVEVLNPRSD